MQGKYSITPLATMFFFRTASIILFDLACCIICWLTLLYLYIYLFRRRQQQNI